MWKPLTAGPDGNTGNIGEMDMFGLGRKKKKEVELSTVNANVRARACFIKAFDDNGVKYTTFPDEPTIGLVWEGDDLDMRILIFFDEDCIFYRGMLDIKADSDMYQDVCWNLNAINSKITYGAFNLDVEEGKVFYDYALILTDGEYAPGIVMGVTRMIVDTIDKYDGDLKAIAEL